MPTLFLISICVCVYIDCRASLVAQMAKNPPAMQETQVGKIPWRREWQLTPVFLLGESHGQRSLTGYSPWGREKPDTTEQLNNNNNHYNYHLAGTENIRMVAEDSTMN